MGNASYVLLRLPLEVRDLFREWLMANYPGPLSARVFKLIRDMRGGKDYDLTFGTRMTGTGPIAWMIGRRFEVACERLGFNMTSVEDHDRAFPAAAAGAEQLICSYLFAFRTCRRQVRHRDSRWLCDPRCGIA